MLKVYWKFMLFDVILFLLCEWVEVECNMDLFVVKLFFKELCLRNVCCFLFLGIIFFVIEMLDMLFGLMVFFCFIFWFLLLIFLLFIVNFLKFMFLEEFEWIKVLEECLVGMLFCFFWVLRFFFLFIKDLFVRLYFWLLFGIDV